MKLTDLKIQIPRHAEQAASSEALPQASGHEIAVIGLSVKLPLADRADQFWENLRNGVDCVRPLPESRKPDIVQMLPLLNIQADTTAFPEAAYLDEIDTFDYSFFRMSPKEAALMDPNQRIFLQTAWGAIEDAGYGGKRLVGSRTGVYVGYGSDTEYKRAFAAVDPALVSVGLAGNTRPIIASRLAYLLDLRGPNLIVDTTCSSSLLAVHLACQALRNGECDMALAGGVQLHLLPVRQTSIGVEAADGRAKTFDERADGTGTGEGAAAIVLKPLKQALADGDSVYAVIKGSAVNHDGTSIGITAPNAVAQEDVIARAWKDAQVEPETITYIEAHGTGTKLGDPIEIDGMQRAFGRFTQKRHFCAIGALKTNIGHLDNTAGIAGLIKTVLMLKHKELPPSLHFQEPNRKINFEQSPVYVNSRLKPWESEGRPRRCGVSAFGLSGTNCHVVLEEAPAAAWQNGSAATDGLLPGQTVNEVLPWSEYSSEAAGASQRPLPRWHLLALSAKSKNALLVLLSRYTDWLQRHDGEAAFKLEDLCYTANTGRGHYTHRLALRFRTRQELERQLAALLASQLDKEPEEDGQAYYRVHRIISARQAAQHASEVTERDLQMLSDAATQLLDTHTGDSLEQEHVVEQLGLLYVKGAAVEWDRLFRKGRRRKISLPTYPFEPTRCWLDERLLGQRLQAKDSAQAYSALLDRCVVRSGELEVYETELSVSDRWILQEHKIMDDCVLVGTAYLEMVLEACERTNPGKSVEFRQVQFHAPLTVKADEPILARLLIRTEGEGFAFTVESLPKRSIQEAEPELWTRHVEGRFLLLAQQARAPVAAVEALQRRLSGGQHVVPDLEQYNSTSVFEFGPRWNNIREMLVGAGELLSVLRMPEAFVDELSAFTLYPSMMDNALTTMPLIQQAIAIQSLTDDSIYLPFGYERFSVHRRLPSQFYSHVRLKTPITEHTELIRYDLDLFDLEGRAIVTIEGYSLKKARKTKLQSGPLRQGLFHQLEWTPAPLEALEQHGTAATSPDTQGHTLVLGADHQLTLSLAEHLRAAGHEVTMARPAAAWCEHHGRLLDFPVDQHGFESLTAWLKERGVTRIVHALSVAGPLDGRRPETVQHFNEAQRIGTESLFWLTKALFGQGVRTTMDIVLLTFRALSVASGDEPVFPEQAPLIGLGKVIGQEYASLKCRAIDVDEHARPDQLAEEMAHGDTYQVAYRNGLRYMEEFRELDLGLDLNGSGPEAGVLQAGVKQGGSYVITGGTGGIGLEIARCLASSAKVRLALINRTALPGRQEWDRMMAEGSDRKRCRAITAIRDMERSGSQVMCVAADVSNEMELTSALQSIRERHGAIDGIIHAAGVAGDGFLLPKELETFRDVLAPKVRGTWLLDRLTRSDRLDFFLLFSSNTTLLGVPGQGDYTAANAYLDSYGAYLHGDGRSGAVIAWPAWKETGMAVDYGVNQDNLLKAIPTAQALSAFELLLGIRAPKVHVGELNYLGSLNGKGLSEVPIRFSEAIRKRMVKPGLTSERAGVKKQPTAVLTGKQAADISEFEVQIAAVWQDVLGFEELNVYDPFFDIGGDSILLTRVHAQLERLYPGLFTVADLFTHTSIASLAQYALSLQTGDRGQPIQSGSPRTGTSAKLGTLTVDLLLEQLLDGSVSVDEALDTFLQLEVV